MIDCVCGDQPPDRLDLGRETQRPRGLRRRAEDRASAYTYHTVTGAISFTDLGVRVVNPSLSPVVELEYLLLYPSVSSLLADLEDEHDVTEVRLACPDVAGLSLRDLGLAQGVMVIMVRRGDDVIYPRGETRLQIGDRLTLIGPLEGVRELVRRCR